MFLICYYFIGSVQVSEPCKIWRLKEAFFWRCPVKKILFIHLFIVDEIKISNINLQLSLNKNSHLQKEG